MGNFGSCHVGEEHTCTHVRHVRAKRRLKRLAQVLLVLNVAMPSGNTGGAWVPPGAILTETATSSSRARFRLTGRGSWRNAVPPPSAVPAPSQPSEGPLALGRKAWSSTADGFLELLVYTTLWMSFSLASLVPFVQLQCGFNVDQRPFWAAASESVAVYTLDHLHDISKATKSTGEHKMSSAGRFPHRVLLLRVLLAVSILALAGSLIAARSWMVSLTFLGHVLLCAAYAKLKPRMPYCKAFYVSTCVVFMAVAAPSAYAPALLGSLSGASLGQMLLLIFSVALTVEQLQDLRDVDEDLEAQVVTLASGFGPRRARQLLLVFQAAALFLHLWLMQWARLPLRPHFLAVHVACSLCSMGFSRQTPRSLFQVLLEPLYALPLLATALRASSGLSL
ncbi:unnamed protein product [Durusdinium trenchii]|uniref:Uncharacterized protein n=1 Tax=Durusdinium trenchii TaxID=1381693 RepID=A0ABP0S7M5_9DINO